MWKLSVLLLWMLKCESKSARCPGPQHKCQWMIKGKKNRVKSKRALVVFRTFIPPPEFQPAWSVPPPLNLDERSYSLSSLLSIYQLSHQVEFCRFWFRCALFLFEITHLFILFLDLKKNIYEKFTILFNLYILLLWYTSKFIVHRPSNGESRHRIEYKWKAVWPDQDFSLWALFVYYLYC